MADAVIFRYANDGSPSGMLEYIEGMHEEDLDGTDTLKVKTFVRPWKRARLVWRDPHDEWREHMVDSQVRTHSGGRPVVESTCVNSVNELYGVQAEGTKLKGTVQELMDSLLKPTRWTSGKCGAFDSEEYKLEVWHKSVRECITELIDLCDGELVTKVDVGDHGVTKRTVRIVEERGNSTVRRQFRWGRNMSGVKRTVGSDEVYTAIVGYGKKLLEIELENAIAALKAEDDAIKAEQEAINAAAGSNPSSDEKKALTERRKALTERRKAQSAKKSALNEKLKAARDDDYLERLSVTVKSDRDLARWGTPAKDGMGHTWAVYTDDDCTDKEFLRRQCRKQLRKLSRLPVCYEFEAHQLDADGWADVRLGNSVHVVDDDLGVDQVERVSHVKRDLKGRDSCTISVGTRRKNPIVEKFKAVEKAAKKSTGNSARVQAAAPVTTNGDYSGGVSLQAALGSGDDQWVHQINGETVSTGTVNFVTYTGGA